MSKNTSTGNQSLIWAVETTSPKSGSMVKVLRLIWVTKKGDRTSTSPPSRVVRERLRAACTWLQGTNQRSKSIAWLPSSAPRTSNPEITFRLLTMMPTGKSTNGERSSGRSGEVAAEGGVAGTGNTWEKATGLLRQR